MTSNSTSVAENQPLNVCDLVNPCASFAPWFQKVIVIPTAGCLVHCLRPMTLPIRRAMSINAGPRSSHSNPWATGQSHSWKLKFMFCWTMRESNQNCIWQSLRIYSTSISIRAKAKVLCLRIILHPDWDSYSSKPHRGGCLTKSYAEA